MTVRCYLRFMITFGNINDGNFLAPTLHLHEDGSATVTVVASVMGEELTSEQVEVVARVEGAQAKTVAEVQKEGMNRACAILQAAGRALSDQIHVDPPR